MIKTAKKNTGYKKPIQKDGYIICTVINYNIYMSQQVRIWRFKVYFCNNKIYSLMKTSTITCNLSLPGCTVIETWTEQFFCGISLNYRTIGLVLVSTCRCRISVPRIYEWIVPSRTTERRGACTGVHRSAGVASASLAQTVRRRAPSPTSPINLN